MPKRVILCGSGQVGIHGLRGILHHPELELVGQYVWSPEKVGLDCGTIAGEAPIGVRATNDWNALLALGADCVAYYGRFNKPGHEHAPIDDIVPFLERGTNVVTIAAFELGHHATIPPQIEERVERACAKGKSSVYFTGIDPGWATTDLAIAALAASDRVDCVRVLELGWWGDYSAEHSCREFFGFGQKPGYQPLLLTRGALRTIWEPTLRHIAEALGREIESWNTYYETDTLPYDVNTGFGVVKAGTAVTLHFALEALSGGKPIAVVEHVDSVDRASGKQWKQPFGPGDLSYRIEIEGDPSFTIEMNFQYADGLKLTAMPAINSIPAVCDARPGVLMPTDVPRLSTKKR